MRSSKESLEKRGFIDDEEKNLHYQLSFNEKINLLNSKTAKERTLAAKLLATETKYVADQLIVALRKEKKLYSKIEITKALIAHKKDSTQLLTAELGKIGSNQHQSVPTKQFGKSNYPLPRDIAARTLASIGECALPDLLQVLEQNNVNQISEAIDAIGYICFYHPNSRVFEKLKSCYEKHLHNELIRWKIVRAMSAFVQSTHVLNAIKNHEESPGVILEANRSLRLIGKRVTNCGV
ncbi:HEAT repeat domain-containing protein [Alkalitalea saponilacus]|uniref:HEAT repeat-containing protein n=1 Tax=Alkalitalea saponilacus TaxID=889453 RepID=A0A1T5DKG1_9BACT|nr:hypothetical protein [Alkalitalea saponilacus]ASB50715.1 hypothetical protein CDL62_16950 [Alkalitalea saponilacus]SKB71943.1 hypothetical protein SAMN03080601_01130 [Alkalitalea saponilacus]